MTIITDTPEETEVSEETIETQPEEEVTPEATPEQIAREWLKEQGIEDIDLKKVRNISQWEKDTNKKASELGNIAKALESKEPEEAPALDPETKAELSRALKEVYGIDPSEMANVVKMAKQTVDEGRNEAFESFIEAHEDVKPDALIAELLDSGFDPDTATPATIRKALNKAYKSLKADSVDPAEIAKKAVADYLADLASKGVKPEDVTEVKKGRGSAAGAHRDLDDVIADGSVHLFDKFAALQDVPI